ncbi:MAG: hypothetical protein ACSNEK_10365 [Parachlamydiaceae bacterium]
MKTNLKWHLLVLEIADELTGDALLHVLNLLMQIENYQYAILNDMFGAPKKGRGPTVFHLQTLQNQILPIEKILKALPNIQQLEWGDFFFFEHYPNNWPGVEQGSYYPPLIKESVTTLRVVDQTYIYIYTTSLNVIKLIQEDNSPDYIIESIETDVLENLSYPY